MEPRIVFDNVSCFYGEVLGVNRVHLSIPPGVTSLVGPNGSGKTTFMNLMSGLIRPTQGQIRVLGIPPDQPEKLFRKLGYCTQFDNFPKGLTGYAFLYSYLLVHGFDRAAAEKMAWEALERVNMTEAAHRKGPEFLFLYETLNGLDPMARAETIALFEEWGKQGLHVVVSSHILHEVDRISDQVILLSHGYVVAEGEIQGVRSEVKDQPMQILVRCNKPAMLASRLFQQDHVVEARIHEDGGGLLVRTRDADALYLLLNRVILETGLEVETVAPADEDVNSAYQYLIGADGGAI